MLDRGNLLKEFVEKNFPFGRTRDETVSGYPFQRENLFLILSLYKVNCFVRSCVENVHVSLIIRGCELLRVFLVEFRLRDKHLSSLEVLLLSIFPSVENADLSLGESSENSVLEKVDCSRSLRLEVKVSDSQQLIRVNDFDAVFQRGQNQRVFVFVNQVVDFSLGNLSQVIYL